MNTPTPAWQYIPIIKWQKWEQKALQHLDAQLAQKTLPCIEARTHQQQFNLAEKLLSVWPRPSIVDFADPGGYLTGGRANNFTTFLQEARTKGVAVIPALNPEDNIAIASASLMQAMVACGEILFRVRLPLFCVPDSTLQACQRIATRLSGQGARIRLLIDFQETPPDWGPNNLEDLAHSVQKFLTQSYTQVHFASGAFPASLESVKTGAGVFTRHDWRLWCEIQHALTGQPIGFSDYGVLSPTWSEKTLELRSKSTNLKYTAQDHWLVLRTAGKTKDELIALSTLLVNIYPHLFKGAGYSYGDKLIADRANTTVPLKLKRCGHYNITDAWNHHIAFVVQEHY